MPINPLVVGANIDTWILNVKGTLSASLDQQLDVFKAASQDAETDLATHWSFAGQPLYIKAHGSGRQWRWILHCPSLHLDIGRGRLNGIIAKARLASVFLWEQGPDIALAQLYAFLVELFGAGFTLQVSEAHLCVDIAGWELSLDEAPAFITRGHKRGAHMEGEESRFTQAWDKDQDQDAPFIHPPLEVNQHGRRCTGYEFSKGAAHSCCLYDKTKELTISRKDWMQEVWRRHGWDGVSRVVRVEFRYKRECLHEMGVEEPYAMLDQLAGLWAYSSAHWLRHTVPTSDTNKGRWPLSPFWQAVQQADFGGDGTAAVRERKVAGDLRLICQMLAGCSTTAAAFLARELPETDDGSSFLRWFYDWMGDYHEGKGLSFDGLREAKRLRLGIMSAPDEPAA
jgi:hypothetical protein